LEKLLKIHFTNQQLLMLYNLLHLHFVVTSLEGKLLFCLKFRWVR